MVTVPCFLEQQLPKSHCRPKVSLVKIYSLTEAIKLPPPENCRKSYFQLNTSFKKMTNRFMQKLFPDIFNVKPLREGKALVVIPVQGTGQGTKTDEFLQRFQTAFDPHPYPSEWSLSLEIMYMHFILSGPHTYLHMQPYPLSKICNIIFPKIYPIW